MLKGRVGTMWRSCDISPLAKKNKQPPYFLCLIKGINGTTGRSHVTRQLWHVRCYMTQKETFLCHLDGHHEVLVVLKVPKGVENVCHGYSKVEFSESGSTGSRTLGTALQCTALPWTALHCTEKHTNVLNWSVLQCTAALDIHLSSAVFSGWR